MLLSLFVSENVDEQLAKFFAPALISHYICSNLYHKIFRQSLAEVLSYFEPSHILLEGNDIKYSFICLYYNGCLLSFNNHKYTLIKVEFLR